MGENKSRRREILAFDRDDLRPTWPPHRIRRLNLLTQLAKLETS